MKSVHEVLSDIQARLNAPKGQYNSFGKYKYRSLEDIQAALKPLLAEHGAYVINSDEIVVLGDRYYVKATATLVVPIPMGASSVTLANATIASNNASYPSSVSVTSFAREDDSKKGMDASQLTGATSSYARKYAMNALFAIDDTKDSDATNTNDKSDSKKPAAAKPPESKPANKPADTKPPSVTLDVMKVMIEECKTVVEVEDLYRNNNKNKQLDSHADKQEILSAFQARKRALASAA